MSDIALDAARAIADKAERMLAKLKPDDRKAAGKRRQAAAMLSLAAQLDPGRAPRAAETGSEAPDASDREAAASEIYSLAMRREQAASTRELRRGERQDRPTALAPLRTRVALRRRRPAAKVSSPARGARRWLRKAARRQGPEAAGRPTARRVAR